MWSLITGDLDPGWAVIEAENNDSGQHQISRLSQRNRTEQQCP